MGNKNSLDMFVEELEDLIAREENNPSTKPPERGRLWELSIITKSHEEMISSLRGYLADEKKDQFKFISSLGYIFNLDRLINGTSTPKNYISRLELISEKFKLMNQQIDTRDYDLVRKTVEEMLNISISLWLEEAKTLSLEPLKTLKGKEQEDYMRLLTDLVPEHDQYHDNLIPYFIKLVQDSKL